MESALLIASRLKLLELLTAPSDYREVAAQLGLRPHRLRALLDVLTLEGTLRRTQTSKQIRYESTGVVPNVDVEPAQWWKPLVESFTRDRALELGDGDGTAEQRFCEHLGRIGHATAASLWKELGTSQHLLDIGGGDGVYTETFLQGDQRSRATLVEKPQVIPIAANRLTSWGDRVELISADARDIEFEPVHTTVLLANLLHLCGPSEAAKLIEKAAAGLAPDGKLVVVEVELDEDRAGPPTGVYFSFNMAVYTDAGRVYTPSTMTEWLRDVGLKDAVVHSLEDHAETVVLTGRRQPE